MTDQEIPSPNLLNRPKSLLIDPVKDTTAIGITCKRYYEPTEKRDSTYIPLKISVIQENENTNLDIDNSKSLCDNAESKDQTHNWENDPLGLCLPLQENETSPKETENSLESKDNNIKEHEEFLVTEQVNEKSTDSIEMKDVISPIVRTMSRYMTATSADFAQIDGISPIHSPRLLYGLNSAEPCNGLMWKIQEPLSRWLYEEKKNNEQDDLASIASTDPYSIAWDTIFHPMSTFQYVKGELEYCNWNPDDEPVTDDFIIQHAIQGRLYPVDGRPSFAQPVQTKATIPQLAPTPLLKPSPVITIVSELDIDQASIVTQDNIVNPDKQKYYFTMLQNIRAPSHNTATSFQTTTKKSKVPQAKKEENMLSSLFGAKNSNTDESEIEKGIDAVIAEKHRYWNERRLFWFGFLCPLLWFYGSVSKYRNSVNKKWQKRCRLAALYFSVVVSIVALVVVVKMAGTAAIRQSQSDTIRAVIAN
ncbi:hypothetical protein K501DRAFT_279863 [Backusella circina FSU 941]|nr:hypothetical protein K501DRAFT_279863 [Backusella circina FSU 941]